MNQCDRCVKEPANILLKVQSDKSGLNDNWWLCSDCADYVFTEARKSVENYRPAELLKFCVSLTPDQAKQVELYIRSRSKVSER